jgi:alkylmercury lyase-like protein
MPETTRTGVMAGGAAALVVLCCAVPAIAATGAGVGVAAWLGAHGLWLLAGLVAGGAATVPAVTRRRHGHQAALPAGHRDGDGRIAVAPQRMGAARGAELDAPSRLLYHWILRDMASGRVPTAADLRDAAAHLGVDAAAALDRMRALDLVLLDGAGAVRCAYPFSADHTGHEVRLSGAPNSVQAMCAVDALGIPYMLRRAAEIVSADPSTHTSIHLAVDPAAQPTWQPPHAVVLVGATAAATPCSVSELACPYISFFESAAAAQAYLQRHPEITGSVLSMPDAIALGRAIFEDALTG